MGVEDLGTDAAKATPAKKESIFQRLYVGSGAFDIIGSRKRWYMFFGALVLGCILSMSIKGFNLGIDFEGGTQIQFSATGSHGQITEDQAKEVFKASLGKESDEVQKVGTGTATTLQIRTGTLDNADISKLKKAIAEKLAPLDSAGQPGEKAISDSAVSASWGGEISQKALIALGIFLLAVVIFLAVYFDLQMAIAAFISLIHDIVVTAGVYSLIGFEVSPATVIGLLTILGFSLYDTVVVFDKVRENTRGLLGLTRRTYAEAANLALNQTLMRSFNTAFIALLPILGLLIVGTILLGSGTLQDLALVQLTGTIVGVLSSVALATPLLVDLKLRDPKYRQQADRVAARRAKVASKIIDDGFDASDDEALSAELRKEKAFAAASSVPGRIPKNKPTAKRKK